MKKSLGKSPKKFREETLMETKEEGEISEGIMWEINKGIAEEIFEIIL